MSGSGIGSSLIDDVSQSIYTATITNIKKYLGKYSGWIIDWVIDHTISISKYNPWAGSSYIKLAKKRKGLINIKNIDDNEFFKWYLVRYLNPANRHPATITKADKYFDKALQFKDINFPVKFRDIHKIENKNSIGIGVFG